MNFLLLKHLERKEAIKDNRASNRVKVNKNKHKRKKKSIFFIYLFIHFLASYTHKFTVLGLHLIGDLNAELRLQIHDFASESAAKRHI